MLVNFTGFGQGVLEGDFLIGGTMFSLDDEHTTALLNGMSEGDYTYLQIFSKIEYETIKVTKVGADLVIERGACGTEEKSFLVGDCVIYYADAALCDNSAADDIECSSLTSVDGSIIIDGECEDGQDLSVNFPDVDMCKLFDDLSSVGVSSSTEFIANCGRIAVSDLCTYLTSCMEVDASDCGAQDGEDGDDGGDGIGVDSAEVNASGHLIITLTDATNIDAGYVVGNSGIGVGVASATINVSGELLITLTDSTVINAGTVAGIDGDDGDDGISASSGDAWIDVAVGVVSHNDAQVSSLATAGGVNVDAKGHVVSQEDGYRIARWTGDTDSLSTDYIKNMTITGISPIQFIFDTPMPHNKYHVSISRPNGEESAAAVISAKNTAGFTLPEAIGEISIFVHE